ncbi:elongation factor 1-beta [Candidatus Woesearchaeota archaeon]|nr:elongation factor 1-beta [Candidatus Woesearchaeota archaeon]
MADVYLTLKVMPTSPDVDLKEVEGKIGILVENFGGKVQKIELQEIAFGLKAMMLTLIMDEEIGSTDDLEAEIAEISVVNSVDVVDVRRALG